MSTSSNLRSTDASPRLARVANDRVPSARLLSPWILSACLLAAGLWALLDRLEERWIYNWDLVAYVGLLEEVEVALDGVPAEVREAEVHRRTYEALESAVPPGVLRQLTAHRRYARHPDFEWARQVTEDPAAFSTTLDWYRGRIGFTALLVVAHRAGAEPVEAVRSVALAGYVALILLLWAWIGALVGRSRLGVRRLGPWIGPWIGSLAALGLGASAPLADAARLFTPDLPAAAFFLAGLWAVLEHRHALPSLLLFLGAVLIRPDFALTTIFVFGCALLVPRLLHRSRPGLVAGGALGLSALYVGLGQWAGHPGWSRLFSYNFDERLVDVTGVSLTWSTYLGAYGKLLDQFGEMSSPLFVALGLWLWATLRGREDAAPPGYVPILGALLLAFGLRFLLFPVFWDRFWIPFDLYVVVVLFAGLAGLAGSPGDRRRP